MKVALAFSTKDRCELTRQTLPPLLEAAVQHRFHLFVFDGSDTQEGERLPFDLGYPTVNIVSNVRGGAGAAIVKALHTLLSHPEGYTHVGLVENDCLLLGDWFPRTMALFDVGADDDLVVGAASARAYQDRVLFQRNGYAVMHNIGAGCIMLTRRAAELILANFRGGYTTDNRRIFNRLAGSDLAQFWAFKSNEHWMTADWHWEAVLAAHGFASLALTPSPCEMVGQVPSLQEQGLTLIDAQPSLSDHLEVAEFTEKLASVREGFLSLGIDTCYASDPMTGMTTIMPHQIPMLGGSYTGGWSFADKRGFGPFRWKADEPGANADIPVNGACSLLFSGGANGGKVRITSSDGYAVEPDIPPEGHTIAAVNVAVPGQIAQGMTVSIEALSPGICFHALQVREPQVRHAIDVGKFFEASRAGD